MLLFIDESGIDRRTSPYEVLAGVAIRENDLWEFIQAIRAAEQNHFGCLLSDLGVEFKGKKLLKRKMFRFAAQDVPLPPDQRRDLAFTFLQKGQRAAAGEAVTYVRNEFSAYGQAVLAFVEQVYELCTSFQVKIFASMVARDAPRPAGENFLRKDYVYLFERYFYYLEDTSPDETGLIVFDELEKTKCRRLLDQMERYFLRSTKGRQRSKRIVPEPFFVHSDLTTGVQVVDIVAYSLNWGLRLKKMNRPTRPEMEPFGQLAFSLRYIRSRGRWRRYGITYIDDLRGQQQRG